MRLKDTVLIAGRYFIRGKWRSFLTITAIAIGVAAVILIGTLGETGKELIQNELNNLGIDGLTIYKSGGGGSVKLSAADAEAIEARMEDIDISMPVTIEYGKYRLSGKNDQAVVWGVDENIGDILNFELVYGRIPTASDVQRNTKVAVIEDNLAMSAYSRENIVGKYITLTVSSKNMEFEIIGIINNKDSSLTQLTQGYLPTFVYVPFTTLGEMIGYERIDQIAITCAADSDSDAIGQEVVTYLSRKYSGNGAAFTAQNIGSYKNQVSAVINLVTLFLSAVAAISLCVAGIGIMNAMLSTTHERKSDIGICMAMGARRRDVALSYLTEAGIISGVGGLIGVIAGISICLLICLTLDLEPVIRPFYIIAAELVSVICGLLFGMMPALKASKLDPIAALRS